MSKPSKALMFLLALHLGGCASSQPSKPLAEVPDRLRPSANESLAMIVPARGVQIYECRARKDQPEAYQWAFVAPEADL
jgi:hypothetical protein